MALAKEANAGFAHDRTPINFPLNVLHSPGRTTGADAPTSADNDQANFAPGVRPRSGLHGKVLTTLLYGSTAIKVLGRYFSFVSVHSTDVALWSQSIRNDIKSHIRGSDESGCGPDGLVYPKASSCTFGAPIPFCLHPSSNTVHGRLEWR